MNFKVGDKVSVKPKRLEFFSSYGTSMVKDVPAYEGVVVHVFNDTCVVRNAKDGTLESVVVAQLELIG